MDTSAPTSPSFEETDEGYYLFEKDVNTNISSVTSPLFTTDADPDEMWTAYIGSIPLDRRNHYTCNCCRRFIEKFGALVTIENGETKPVAWRHGAPSKFFALPAQNLYDTVDQAKVTGVFYAKGPFLGVPESYDDKRRCDWTHLHGKNPKPFVNPLKTAYQAMAEKNEEYGMLSRGLADYNHETVKQALRVLKADAVSGAEKALSVAEWFERLHCELAATRNDKARKNIIWSYVAVAPPGFCHIRTTMINTLLDDIVNGLSMDAIARKWAEKVHPLNYMRPKAAPSEGAITEAEKLVEKLGLAPSLERRYATLADIQVSLWRPSEPPKDVETKAAGVFDHLRAKSPGTKELELPTVSISWEKFYRTILGNVHSMELSAPSFGPYYALITAVNPEAPPIIQWDGLEGYPRNPVNMYVYSGGSAAAQWGLKTGWNKVNAICHGAQHWQKPDWFKQHKATILFALEGCKDQRHDTSGLALFPEVLKNDLHGIRKVAEAHSNRGKLQGFEEGNANGVYLIGGEGDGVGTPVTVRVRTGNEEATYKIDRWE